MTCPYCGEELGLNNICINVTCSYFGNTIDSSENSKLNEINESNLESENTIGEFSDFNSNFNNISDTDYNDMCNTNLTETPINISSYFNDNISSEEFTSFIGHNADYYLKYANKMNNNFLSWNWSCFFLSNYWLLYRKIYIPSVIIVLFNFVSLKLFGLKTQLFLALIVHVVLAIFSNSIYLKHCKHEITNIKLNIAGLNQSEYINKLYMKGGTSLIPPLILLSLSILIAIFYISIYIVSILNQPDFPSPTHYA